MKENKNVMIIGGGNMGKSITQILSSNGWSGRVTLAVKSAAQQKAISSKFGSKVNVITDGEDHVSKADIIIIAVKPQNLPDLYKVYKDKIQKDALLISIVAGTKIESLISGFNHKRVIRSMPNTPIRVSQGITIWIPSSEVTDNQKSLAQNIFKLWGMADEVNKEILVDVGTAVFGTGPASVFYILESFTEAAIRLGYPWDNLSELIIQLFYGSIALAEQEKHKHFAELRDQVTSPGGTTAEANYVFDKRSLKAIIKEAVKSAFVKAQGLGQAD
ncbi:pyrroline-5-carboxylate reductase [bacterium]|jgi:pyrroline-5-carboxylate reductase|nr:pyrroline-5-carboxylate reductase [bacterium]MBT4121736.1 pyrroline-5-carboxylate reductase [bacterium]MBT4495804.1 pyrroline-5-carboxylate reductase [bacterium]MBT4763878.1 pyrroline-5-carboxylate reductase [bacterium]MBT5401248.1 pyrroline-5-carboxylate reductase [bacterium]